MATDEEAYAAGISPKSELRNELIIRRERLMQTGTPDWDTIVLFTHIIWWLSDAN